ncbi:SDR family NAD(P)-dependent oxidoreductase [bacterium]|nr:SDR family NAD(P)-dependent oxidoreductase [bacterium]
MVRFFSTIDETGMRTMSLPRGVVWITGASNGIGREAAKVLAQRGWTVAASARNKEALQALAKEFETIRPYPLDITHPKQRNEVYRQLRKDLGPVDALVNNAGYGTRGTVEEIDLNEMRMMYDANVLAPIALARLVLPEMRERRLGRIVMVSSVVGRVAFPLNGLYSSSKYALEGLTDALRIELQPWDIKVSLVEPGPIATGFAGTAKSNSTTRLYDEQSPYARHYNTYLSGSFFPTRQVWGPQPCAEAIRDAVENSKPKYRYPVHPVAHLLPFLQKILPTRWMDRIMGQRLGFNEKASL